MGGTVPEFWALSRWCQPSRNGRDSPVILGLVPVMLVMSRIYMHLALPSAGFHSLMAALRISSLLSSLVLFDTHKATTKTALRHFLTEKSQNYYNFGSSVWLCANSEQPSTLFRLEVWHTRCPDCCLDIELPLELLRECKKATKSYVAPHSDLDVSAGPSSSAASISPPSLSLRKSPVIPFRKVGNYENVLNDFVGMYL